VIELWGVGVTYKNGGVIALKGINLTIKSGDFAFLVGPTGSGKSTLLKLFYGEVKATEGTLQVAGKDITDLPLREIPALRRQMGIVLQDYGLLPQRTVRENVTFACEVVGMPRREIKTRVPEVLERVGVQHRSEAFPSELSGGEQQRVAIARALVSEPKLLIADEPTGNLDPETGAGVLETLLRVNAQGTTIVIATHDKAAVDRLKKRVIAIERGELVRDDEAGSYGYEV
jgi:cell division transport system ATP-binding protein